MKRMTITKRSKSLRIWIILQHMAYSHPTRVHGAYASEALANSIKADLDKAFAAAVERGDDVFEVAGVDVEGLSS